MSELKTYKMVDEKYCTDCVCVIPSEVYLKSEADKVIALLKDKAKYNEYAYKHKSEEFADTCRFYEKELRHQKYKRCLAMWLYLRECYWRCENHNEQTRANWYNKWMNVFQKLAEKFKPNNSTAQ